MVHATVAAHVRLALDAGLLAEHRLTAQLLALQRGQRDPRLTGSAVGLLAAGAGAGGGATQESGGRSASAVLFRRSETGE